MYVSSSQSSPSPLRLIALIFSPSFPCIRFETEQSLVSLDTCLVVHDLSGRGFGYQIVFAGAVSAAPF